MIGHNKFHSFKIQVIKLVKRFSCLETVLQNKTDFKMNIEWLSHYYGGSFNNWTGFPSTDYKTFSFKNKKMYDMSHC